MSNHQVHLILDYIANQGLKLEKLNNIINELDKYILEIYNSNYVIKDEHILGIWNKLQELIKKQ